MPLVGLLAAAKRGGGHVAPHLRAARLHAGHTRCMRRCPQPVGAAGAGGAGAVGGEVHAGLPVQTFRVQVGQVRARAFAGPKAAGVKASKCYFARMAEWVPLVAFSPPGGRRLRLPCLARLELLTSALFLTC